MFNLFLKIAFLICETRHKLKRKINRTRIRFYIFHVLNPIFGIKIFISVYCLYLIAVVIFRLMFDHFKIGSPDDLFSVFFFSQLLVIYSCLWYSWWLLMWCQKMCEKLPDNLSSVTFFTQRIDFSSVGNLLYGSLIWWN